MNTRSNPTPLALSLATLGLAGLASAQQFDVRVVARGLDAPTGIVVTPGGEVYVTEVPQPGMAGGANRVARLEADGSRTTVSAGEPEPVNLAADDRGNLYWTCRTAGVIVRRNVNGNVRTWRTGLRSPTGISAPRGGDRVYYTEVPTPGVPGSGGGANGVAFVATASGRITQLNRGEPEPVDVVADAAGNAYWTCRTAGVILRHDAVRGATEPLLTGLDAPTGIAMDGVGNLYFTEVPDPGVGGAGNAVWKFDLARRALTLVSRGEPEPVDVAANADGSRVYWTCRTAGVVVMASPTGMRPTVDAPATAAPGGTVDFDLGAGSHAGATYVAGTSLGRGPIDLGSAGSLALGVDELLVATVGGSFGSGYRGSLDGAGRARAMLPLPSLAALRGLSLYTAFAILDPTAPLGLTAPSDTHVLRIR